MAMSEEQQRDVNFDGWMWLAPQYFNQWRIFPRAFIIFYFWLCMETAMWFMGLPAPGAAQAAFASAIISAGAAWFGLYVNSGPRPVHIPETMTHQQNQYVPPENYDPETRVRSEPSLQRRREPGHDQEPPRG
jgi:hypothetical protein